MFHHLKAKTTPDILMNSCAIWACTCADAVLQRVPAVNEDLLQRLGLVTELQVEALDALQELVWMVEVQNFGGSFESLANVIGEDLHNLKEKLHSWLFAIFSRK